MGSFLDTPKTEKETERHSNGRLKCAVSSMQGWRIEMEVRTGGYGVRFSFLATQVYLHPSHQQDAHTIMMDVKGLPGFSFFGVYDGHGGSLVSNQAYVLVVAHLGTRRAPPAVSHDPCRSTGLIAEILGCKALAGCKVRLLAGCGQCLLPSRAHATVPPRAPHVSPTDCRRPSACHSPRLPHL